MDAMEIDSPPDSTPPRPRDRVVRRLLQIGVPEEFLDYRLLVTFAKSNGSRIPELVSVVLPSDAEVAEVLREAKARNKKVSVTPNMKNRFRESMLWLQWLMFEGDPDKVLRKLSKTGQRGVCAAVWGNNDIAYRCRTCELDPTCAICVPCFQNGNHKDHDYSIIYTGGGCCDCGDVTAWKREGFCSKHKGAEQIRPLPEKFADSVGPVLHSLFVCWEDKLSSAETNGQETTRLSDRAAERRKVANELTFAVVEMLLEFCKNSESLLSFVSKRVISAVGLLEILVRAERFLSEAVVKKLHELLLKLLGDPVFKYEFARVFLNYYPVFINDAIREKIENAMEIYPLLSTFSVQIFTVPTLTPRLVQEMNLLEMLLGCLGEIFISCAGEDGRVQVSKLSNLNETTNRVIGDIRFVLSHVVVSRYATHAEQDISRTWMRLLVFVQGMDPQKRETGIHIQEENEYIHMPLILDQFIASIQPLLVDGAFSTDGSEEANMQELDTGDGDNVRHAKVGSLTPEGRGTSSSCSSNVCDAISDPVAHLLVPPAVTRLAHECLCALESWLGVDDGKPTSYHDASSPSASSTSVNNFLALKKTLSKIRKGKNIFNRLSGSSEVPVANSDAQERVILENAKDVGEDRRTTVTPETYSTACLSADCSESEMGEENAAEASGLHVLSLSSWPDILYDVSLQEVSVHIPLHRLLSMILQKALRRCYGESRVPNVTCTSSESPLSATSMDFFKLLHRGCHRYGFSAFLMEHPLRIRVFCAQVHGGMWRRNGDAALTACEWYRSIRWSEQSLELDLFLLQFCAALAPADLYVNRILERFGLSDYLSLGLERSNEYEPVLVQEMLTLIIQIIQERRFSGLTAAESLKRELVHKLAVGDATHSQLVKSLPRDLSKFGQLQEILDRVAAYSHPSGFNQGKYSLRWPYWKELDLFHPRLNSRDLQLAEERYMRFCSVSALTTQLPRWTKIYHPLEGVANVATCKTALQIIRAVLFYSVYTHKLSESRAPYGVLLTAMHLLALALDICVQKKKSCDQSHASGYLAPILVFASEEISDGSDYGSSKQSLLSLLVLLMKMYKEANRDNFLEAGNCDLSSLIESSLKKFAELDSKCMTKLQQFAPEVVSHLLQTVPSSDSSVSSVASDSEKRKAKARERQAAILEKMKAEQAKFLTSISSTNDDGMESAPDTSNSNCAHELQDSVQDVCSLCHDANSTTPVSYLILLQKSRLLSFVDRGPPSWEQVNQLGKESVSIATNSLTSQDVANSSTSNSGAISSSQLTRMAENVVSQLANSVQPREVNAIFEFIKARFPLMRNIQVPSTSSNRRETAITTLEMFEQEIYNSTCRRTHDYLPSANFMEEDTAGPSTEDGLESSTDTDSILLGKYIAALSKEMKENPSASDISHAGEIITESKSRASVYDGFGPVDCDGIHLSSCGHAVHQGCLDRYLSSLKERYSRRVIFEGGYIVDPDQGEFLCPACRRLANSVLPAFPGDVQKVCKKPIIASTGSWLTGNPSSSKEIKSLSFQKAFSLLQSAANEVRRPDAVEALPLYINEIPMTNLEPVSHMICKMYFRKDQDKLSGTARVNYSMIMWDILKYSLMSMEIAARSERTHMAPIYSSTSLYKELRSSSGFVLSLLLRVLQNMRSKNSLHILQRYIGIELFAESICSGVSIDFLGNSSEQKGNLFSILKHADMEVSYPDVQFWNRMSDPVLAHDPFSSLMWVIYCLPCPFISCEESLLSLVHIFYIVVLAQAVIAYCGKIGSQINESSCCDCLITDILKHSGEYGCVMKHFISNHIDPCCDIKDMIRRLSFPFLRRCALLWKLLNSTVPRPFSERDDALDQLSHRINDMDGVDSTLADLNEIQELEKMFAIPPLDIVLKDVAVRSLVFKWFHHFRKKLVVKSFQDVVSVTPAVPFKLMRLPHLYQDLLQRYIKKCCPDCNTVLGEPALCLLCGRLCSPSWRSCCRDSGCQTHALTCGAGTGVFLLIRRSTILLQRRSRQTPWPSLYLDAFGEEDVEMQRGRPLYLNEERYADLTYMVATHGLEQSSKVLSQTTMGGFFLGLD